MAVDIFLDIEGIEGESQAKDFKNKIDVLAWSWGASNSGTAHVGSGSGAGKVNVQDLSVTKYVDSASHALLLSCCSGKHFKKATLTARKAGGDSAVNYLVIEFEKVFVTSVSTGTSSGEDRQTENVSLNFASFMYKYTPQKDDGTADSVKEVGWNIAENTKK